MFTVILVSIVVVVVLVIVSLKKFNVAAEEVIVNGSIWANNEANAELLHGLSFMTIEKYNTYDMYARKIKTLQAQHTGMVYISMTHERAEILMATANNKGISEVCISTYAELGYIC